MSNNPAKPAGGSGMPLEAFIEDARNLDADQFAERFGNGFLMVMAASAGGLRGSTSTVLVLDREHDSGGRTAGIRRKGREKRAGNPFKKVDTNSLALPGDTGYNSQRS